MGWWGYEPWNSDTYGDMCGQLWQPQTTRSRGTGRKGYKLRNVKPKLSMREQVDKWLDDRDYMTRYAACGLVIQLHEARFLYCGMPIMEKALRFLHQFRRIYDKMGWRDPKTFRKTCWKMIRELEKAWLLSFFEKDHEVPKRIAEEEKKKPLLKVKTFKRWRRVRRKRASKGRRKK